MDTTRWKSILVPRGVYLEIKEMSKLEGRTIGGQLCLIFEHYKKTKWPKLQKKLLEQATEKGDTAA